jgi:hypothetical protein
VRRIPAIEEVAILNEQLAPAPLQIVGSEPLSLQRAYVRDEGSLSARALGTVVHAYLDRIAQEFSAGISAAGMQSAIQNWLPRITAMLRSFGLQPADVQRRATQVLTALRSTLDDADGAWVLASHPQAASELAMSTWTSDGTLANYRMDRSFRAGSTPLAAGQNFLWIVDYKVSAQDAGSDATSIAAEDDTHRTQLQTYARVQQLALADADGIRLAAFYPFRKPGEKLKVWEFTPGD